MALICAFRNFENLIVRSLLQSSASLVRRHSTFSDVLKTTKTTAFGGLPVAGLHRDGRTKSDLFQHRQQQRQLYTSVEARREHGSFYALHAPPNIRLETEQEAHELLYFLRKSERDILYKVLHEQQQAEKNLSSGEAEPATREQLKSLFLSNLLPFVGFGVLDNLIMILAGEYIDSTLGVLFALSTMAAAGFGNIISDIAGIGCSHYVEYFVARFFGLRPPALTAQQWDSSRVRWATNGGRALGLTVGCLIGMFPLLFFDETETLQKKLNKKHDGA